MKQHSVFKKHSAAYSWCRFPFPIPFRYIYLIAFSYGFPAFCCSGRGN